MRLAGFRSLMKIERLEIGLTIIAALICLVLAFASLSRGMWLDEFFTLMITPRDASLAEFMGAVLLEPHPILHYGLVYLLQKLGITDVAALRAINFLGVLGVAALVWLAVRRKSITASQACVIVTLYASSSIFLNAFAELRSYFLLYSASLAATLSWKIMFDGAGAPAARRSDWVLWFVALAALANAHYFGTLYGGFLTLSLMVHAVFKRDWRRVGLLALIGAVAAAPAVLLFYLQSKAVLQAGFNTWIDTSLRQSIRFVFEVTGMAVRMNYVVLAAALVSVLFLVESRYRSKDTEWVFWIAATLVAFAAFVVVANTFRSFLWYRYLFAAAGGVIVLAAALTTQPFLPRLTVSAICAAAIVAQCYGIYKPSETGDGWGTSAAYIAQQIEQCPTTKVYAVPWTTIPGSVSTPAMMIGYDYYAEKYHFAFQELNGGGAVPPTEDVCPSLIWVEHSYFQFYAPGVTAEQTLGALNIAFSGNAEIHWMGSGAVISVH